MASLGEEFALVPSVDQRLTRNNREGTLKIPSKKRLERAFEKLPEDEPEPENACVFRLRHSESDVYFSG
jgi:hypothetical protein